MSRPGLFSRLLTLVVSQQILPTQQDVRSSQWLLMQVSQWFPAVALN